MGRQTGKNINMNDSATTDVVSVGSSSAVTLLLADTSPSNPTREVTVTNDGNKALWVRKYPAATDNNKVGVRVPAGESKKVVENSEIYYGEISGIMDSGGAKNVIVEYF